MNLGEPDRHGFNHDERREQFGSSLRPKLGPRCAPAGRRASGLRLAKASTCWEQDPFANTLQFSFKRVVVVEGNDGITGLHDLLRKLQGSTVGSQCSESYAGGCACCAALLAAVSSTNS